MTTFLAEPSANAKRLDVIKLRMERDRFRADVIKWIVVAIGAVASFIIIDWGRFRLEEFRAKTDYRRQLLDAYLKATEAPQPDVWKRKLHILKNYAPDEEIKEWAQAELRFINDFSELDALYRETLKLASQLVERQMLNNPERVRARIRYNQLYWADLPFAGVSSEVIQATSAFLSQLMEAERDVANSSKWEVLNSRLIQLASALKASAPKYPNANPKQ